MSPNMLKIVHVVAMREPRGDVIFTAAVPADQYDVAEAVQVALRPHRNNTLADAAAPIGEYKKSGVSVRVIVKQVPASTDDLATWEAMTPDEREPYQDITIREDHGLIGTDADLVADLTAALAPFTH